MKPLPSVLLSIARAAGFIVSFLLCSGLVWVGADHALTAADQPPPIIGLDLADRLRQWRSDLSHDRRGHRVALLGDSVLGAEPGEMTVPDTTRDALLRQGTGGHRINVYPFSWPGWGIAGQYFLADEIVRARPDLILLELNLRGIGPAPPGELAYPELAGFIATSRLWEAARLPLSYAGLTLDRLLLYRFLVASGLDGSWASLLRRQASLFKLRDPFETWLDAELGSRSSTERRLAEAICTFDRLLVPGKYRGRASHVMNALGDALGGVTRTHHRLRVLDAMLERYRRAKIPVLVWVAPVNVDHLRSLGLPLDGLTRSLATIRGVVESNGAAFIDLHSLLPDGAFRDAGDHVTSTGSPSGAAVLGEHLAAALVMSGAGEPPAAGDALVHEVRRAVQ